MATVDYKNPSEERVELKEPAASLYSAAWLVGGVGIIAAIILGWIFGEHSFQRFFFAYLVSLVYFLSLSLGGLFFVILQHVTKAGWSVNVRRIAEWFAASMPIVALLATPIVVPVLLHRGDLYPWAEAKAAPAAAVSADKGPDSAKSGEAIPGANAEPIEEITGFKKVYLNPFFWIVRIAFYFFVWSTIGIWYWRKSLEQDKTGDFTITSEMQRRSPVAMIAFAVTLTLAAFDLIMTLDPTWSSTIFGVYYFAGSVVGIFATIIIVVVLLQRAGYLRESVTVEHFHDLGKFLFAFIFFWGYIGFSQYMLQWYANLPEETLWYRHHGATTAKDSVTGWSYVCIALLFGHLLIPFAALLSRHVKRNRALLCFWAVWMLVFHWVDMFWLVMPQLDYRHVPFGPVEIVAFLGIGGMYVAFVMSRAAQGALRPIHDPRMAASLQFQNV